MNVQVVKHYPRRSIRNKHEHNIARMESLRFYSILEQKELILKIFRKKHVLERIYDQIKIVKKLEVKDFENYLCQFQGKLKRQKTEDNIMEQLRDYRFIKLVFQERTANSHRIHKIMNKPILSSKFKFDMIAPLLCSLIAYIFYGFYYSLLQLTKSVKYLICIISLQWKD